MHRNSKIGATRQRSYFALEQVSMNRSYQIIQYPLHPTDGFSFYLRPIDSMIRYTRIFRDRRLVLFQHPVQGCLYPRVLDVVAKTLLLLRIFQ